jgi:MurNAc alpha-1-phosphate uridylyltransferase
MLLAAGRGERLRPLTDHRPKPLIEVRGRPLLDWQLGWLQAAGIEDVVINLHHLGEQIAAHCGSGERYGLRIHYSREAERLETGGGIKQALGQLGGEPFLVLNGDIFTTFPLAALLDLPEWADVHLLLTPKPAYREAGDFTFAHGRVTARGDDFVYCGIAILRPSIFEHTPEGAFSLRDLFFDAMAAGRLSGQVWPGFWIDIGSQAQLDAANAATL